MIDRELFGFIENCAAKQGVHIIDVTVRGSRRKSIVEVYIDAEAGVTSDLCSTVSRDIAEILDAGKLIEGSYELVVSSPGIERPLKFRWQYRKHMGRKLLVKTQNGIHEQSGKLLAVADECITIGIGKGNDPVEIRFDVIQEATVQAPW